MIPAAADAACERPVGVAELRDLVAAVDAAAVKADPSAVASADAALDAKIPCLAETVPAELAAKVHRAEGLAAASAGDTDKAGRAFAAGRMAIGSLALPDGLPADAPAVAAFTALPARAVTETAPLVQGGWLELDGTPTRKRPTDRPVLALVVIEGEPKTVSGAVYAWPGDALPTYAVGQEAAIVAATSDGPAAPPRIEFDHSVTVDLRPPKPANVPSAHRGQGAAFVAAGVLGVAAIGTYGAAGLEHARWADPETPIDEIPTLRNRTNNLVVASAGLGALATGVAVGAAIGGKF